MVVSLSLASCDRSDRDAARWLDLEIVRPEIFAPASTVAQDPVPDADGMITKAFRVPPTFFYSPLSSTDPADPFADPESTPLRIVPPQELFEKAGITFGPDAFAVGQPEEGGILVRQTPEQMELVEAYTEGMGPHIEYEVCIRLEVYALQKTAAAELVRSAAPHTDHAPEHRAVIGMVGDRRARLLQSFTLPCRSGQRARIEDGGEVSVTIPTDVETLPSEKNESESSLRIRDWMEVDPVVGADNRTIDLGMRLEIHDQKQDEPQGRGSRSLVGRFPHTAFDSQYNLDSGESRLIGTWPESGEMASEFFCVAFLQAFVIAQDQADQP